MSLFLFYFATFHEADYKDYYYNDGDHSEEGSSMILLSLCTTWPIIDLHALTINVELIGIVAASEVTIRVSVADLDILKIVGGRRAETIMLVRLHSSRWIEV